MEASEFFKSCEISNNCLFLPSRDEMEVDKKVYAKEIRSPLLDLGGKWIASGSYWEFPFDPTDRIEDLINAKKTKLSSKFHFFETPIELCAGIFQFCEEAGIKYYNILDFKTAKCLEPSAGRGNLIRRLFIQGFKDVFYYENMPENLEILKDFDYYGNIPKCLGNDFLKCKDSDFDLILANPPFRHEVKHIEHMFKVCKPGGIILTLSSPKLYNSPGFEKYLNDNSEIWGMRELEADKDYPIFEGTNSGCTIIAAQKKQAIPIESAHPITIQTALFDA